MSQPSSQVTSSGTILVGSSPRPPSLTAAARTGAPASLPGKGLAQALENRQVAGLAEDVQAAIQVCANGLQGSWKGASVVNPNHEDSEGVQKPFQGHDNIVKQIKGQRSADQLGPNNPGVVPIRMLSFRMAQKVVASVYLDGAMHCLYQASSDMLDLDQSSMSMQELESKERKLQNH